MSIEVKLNPGRSTDGAKARISKNFQEVKTGSPLDEFMSLHKFRRELGKKKDDLTLALECEQSDTAGGEEATQEIKVFVREHIEKKLQESNLVLEGWTVDVIRPDSGFSEDADSWKGPKPHENPGVKPTENEVIECCKREHLLEEVRNRIPYS